MDKENNNIPLIKFMTTQPLESDIENEIKEMIIEAARNKEDLTTFEVVEKMNGKRVDSEKTLKIISRLRSDKQLLQVDDSTGIIEVTDDFWK
ncbi:hypothetical protein KKF34_03750 [Myxococcota bacterium]|nr:hypothetical protein [Myxococcota bacterium]MBU1381357.1 hypothetical protein [Myxococcota bacterium]MBU1495970.1 hypothetical protein [Myxococcota bacterium]